jgi:hypothetical protein
MDDSFFKELVEDLGIITKVKYVFIAQCQRDVTPDCVDTIAFWSKGKIIDNIRYALYGTPCEDVLKGNIRIYSERLQALFPEDEDKKHFECLIRMIDENGKIILPGAFFPAAERYDLSTKIDRWVFESTYAWLEKRPGKSKRLTFCSINLSGHSLSNE